MRRELILLSFCLLALGGCGKNAPIAPAQSYNYAPAPPQGGYPAPGGFNQVPYPYQNTGYSPYGGGNQFYPQLPAGYPNQFSPFMPVFDWMRRQQAQFAYWNQIWSGWLGHCHLHQIQEYNFYYFWRVYLPSMGVSHEPWYGYLDSQFYPWVTAEFAYPASVSSSQFWRYYGEFPYHDLTNHYLNFGWDYVY